jgi:predicted permease
VAECIETLENILSNMLSILRDIRLAFRLSWRAPSFTLIALLSIALSVGAMAVVFTAVKSVLLDSLPYTRQSELVQIRTDFPKFLTSLSDWMLWRDGEELVRRTRTLASIGFYRTDVFDLPGDNVNPPEALWGLRVSSNLFPTLGVQPMLGRNILPQEDQPGQQNEMILSYGLWMRRFQGDLGIVGKNIVINRRSCTVIGVMPRGFNFPLREGDVHTAWPYIEFWAPLRNAGTLGPTDSVFSVARLRPGVTLRQAQQDLASIGEDLAREFPATNRDHTMKMGLLLDRALGDSKNALWLLFAASAMFSLIGCANVANMLLAKGVNRQREMAIRMAIGAGATRILRQLLTESCVLASLGGLAGYCLTITAWRLLPAVFPTSIPRLSAARADWKVFTFSLAVAVANGLLFGMAPAFRAIRNRIVPGRELIVPIARPRDRLRGVLVAVEMGLAAALVVGGGQLLASFMSLVRVDPGFASDRVLASVIIPDQTRYATAELRAQLYRQILDGVRFSTGIESAGTIDALPFSGENHGGLIGVNDSVVSESQDRVPAEIDLVSTGYLEAMGVRLIRGEWFHEQDMKDSGDSVIVNDIAAQKLWPRENPIGKLMCVYCSSKKPNDWKRVIGVVSGVRHRSLDEPLQPSVYMASHSLENAAFVVVRSNLPMKEVDKEIRNAVANVDTNQPVFVSTTMHDLIDDSLANRRFIMGLLACAGCLALVMAAGGVYGVTSYITASRTQEIGVHIALGATRRDVEILVFRQGFLSALIGLVSGLALALILMRVLQSVLVGISSDEFPYLWIEAGTVILAAALACWFPARRASRIDPAVALRQE